MSDGLTRLALKMPYEPHVPFFQPLFAYIEETSPANSNGEAEQQMVPSWLPSESARARTTIKRLCLPSSPRHRMSRDRKSNDFADEHLR